MIAVRIENAFASHELVEVLAHLTKKLCGDAPDRKDTATTAYVELRAFASKLNAGAEAFFSMSNEGAFAMRHELRSYFVATETDPGTTLFLGELLTKVEAHIAQLRRKENARKSDAIRRNQIPIRKLREVHRVAERADAAGEDHAGDDRAA